MKTKKILSLLIISSLLAIIVLSVLSCSGPATKKETQLIPRETLFGNPEKVSPRISPDGTLLAYRAPSEGVMNVWVKTIGQEDDHPVTNDDNRGIRRYFWSEDSKSIMYLQDIGGDENWRLYGVNIETRETKDLTPYDNVQVQIIDRSKHYPNDLIIAMNKDNPQLHDVYRLDLTTGKTKLVAKNSGMIMGWITDTNMKVLGAQQANEVGGVDLLVRDSENADFKKLLSWDANDALSSGAIGFTKDGKSLYISDSRDANTSRLIKMNIASGETQIIAEDPKYDVSDVLMHPDSYEIQAVLFTKDRDEWTVFDETVRADFEAIKKLDRGDFFISNRDNADNTWLIGYTVDNGPVPYYAWDRKSQSATFLFVHRPDLKKYELAKMEPISFTASDGLEVHGYLTLPADKEPKMLPMVLNVHGGPWARDVWGYNPEAQWIANRGYACLQINFRGSTGYGKNFLNAGDKEWGAKMQQDLTDAVNWAVKMGYADPAKVAIYGGSYGGYAALAGATFTPDLYCCAVDIVGPSNLITLIQNIPPYWKTFLDIFYMRVGHPEKDEEFLKSRSPLFKVDNIKIPMLIVQGANDPRVNQVEAEQIVEAMAAKGLDYEYLLYPDEGHGLAKPDNRVSMYASVEEFFAKNLGGRFEPADSTVQAKIDEVRKTISREPMKEHTEQ